VRHKVGGLNAAYTMFSTENNAASFIAAHAPRLGALHYRRFRPEQLCDWFQSDRTATFVIDNPRGDTETDQLFFVSDAVASIEVELRKALDARNEPMVNAEPLFYLEAGR